MKKITVSILSVLMMLSMVFSSSVFAANEQPSAWESFIGLFGAQTSDVSDVGVEYRGHVQNKGDFPLDGTWIQGPDQLGTVGEGLRLEAFWIKLAEDAPAGLHIKYQVHVQNKGWMGFVNDGAMAGTEGEGLRIEAIQISLVDDEGNIAQGYSVEYRGHVQNVGDTEWYTDGAQLGTTGSGLRLEALEIKIVQTKADLTAYNAAVAAAAALTEADYTAESWAALQTALTDNVVTEDNTQAEVDAATAAINAAIDGLVAIAKIDTVTATGVKTLTVTFNKALTAEQQASTLLVKKGAITTNLTSTTFAADGMSATIVTASKLTKGTYTVSTTIDGVASTGNVVAEDEKVAAITLTSDTAAQVAGTPSQAYVLYQVSNQYNEKMTGQTISWSQSTGGSITPGVEGVLTIENTTTPGTAFVPGAVVYITGVHAASGTVLNAPVTIGLTSKVDTVDFQGVYNTATKKIEALPAGFVADKYTLLFEAKDQYGNKMNLANFNDLVFTSDNPLFIATPSVAGTDVTLNGTVYESLKLAPGTTPALGGTANVSVISKNTGAKSTYEITADALSMVKTFTMSAPADMIAVGEKIEIPFEAYDQNGVAMTKYSDLNGKVQLTSPTNTTLQFVKNADGTAKLEFAVNTSYTAAITSLTSFVTGQSSFSAITVDVKAIAVPTVIIGLDPEVSTTVAMGQAFNLKTTDLVYQDQYGRIIADAKIVNTNTFVRYKTTNMSGVVGSLTEFAYTSTPASIAVNASGVQTVASIEFALYTDTVANSGTLKAGSEKAFPITVTSQSDYTLYEVADLGTMNNDGLPGTKTSASFDKTVKVYGVKADGTKVLLPYAQFTVTTNAVASGQTDPALAVTNDVIADVAANGYDATNDFKDAITGAAKTVAVKVTVQVKDTAAPGTFKATIVKDLTIEKATSNGTTITMNDTNFGGKYNIGVGTTALNTLAANAIKEVKDQYGVVMTPASTATISNVTLATGSAFTVGGGNITGAVVGDSFTASFTYGSTVYTADFLVNDTDANNTAQLDTNAVNAAIAALTDSSVTITDPAAQPAVTLNVPTAVNGVTFTFTAKTDDNATVAIAGDSLTAAVTRNATAGTPTITVTASKGSATATQVYDITVPAGAAGTDAVTIAKQ